jgi:hypothetical protein
MDLMKVAAVVQAGTGIAALLASIFALVVLIRTLKASHRAVTGQSFAHMNDLLQSSDMRAARKALLDSAWTQANAGAKPSSRRSSARATALPLRKEREKVAQAFDVIGIMCREGLLPRSIVIENWSRTLILCWRACEPHVKALRTKRGEDFWAHFQWLAEEAEKWRSERGLLPATLDAPTEDE